MRYLFKFNQSLFLDRAQYTFPGDVSSSQLTHWWTGERRIPHTYKMSLTYRIQKSAAWCIAMMLHSTSMDSARQGRVQLLHSSLSALNAGACSCQGGRPTTRDAAGQTYDHAFHPLPHSLHDVFEGKQRWDLRLDCHNATLLGSRALNSREVVRPDQHTP